MPDYRFELADNMVTIRPKGTATTPSLPGLFIRLSDQVYEKARLLAPGWDVYALEAEWRDWIADKGIEPHKPEAHFLKFCKTRGSHQSRKTTR